MVYHTKLDTTTAKIINEGIPQIIRPFIFLLISFSAKLIPAFPQNYRVVNHPCKG